MVEIVVVTGGSGGIGGACLRRLLAEGRTVANLDVKEAETPPGAIFIRADLREPAAIADAFAALSQRGTVVGLVNNAGFALSKSLLETEPEDFARLAPLNLVAPALCARLAVEGMKAAGWGRIVNITSRVVLGKERRTAYAATKGGLAAMTRGWALELAGLGVTVNAVGPGPIATELFQQVNPPDSPATRKIVEGIPVGRLGSPEDIANAVAFFLRKDSGFITGQTLYVCGGLSIAAA